jgi:beta-glucosidase
MSYRPLCETLSIEEKIRLLSGTDLWHFLHQSDIGLRGILVADGPHGVRVYKEQTSEADAFAQEALVPTTLFPCASAMASSFNPQLIEHVGKAIGAECNMHGVDILLGPGLNLKRSPLGGRNFEYYSEDPLLTAHIGASFVNGVQSEHVGATIKHFVLNEQETNRRLVDTVVDERTLFEVYGWPFKYVIEHAQPVAVMSSYNKVNGSQASESKYLIKEILRHHFNFSGIVMSDWGGVQNKPKSIKAGTTLEMPGASEFYEETIAAYYDGDIQLEEIDEALCILFDYYEKAINNPNRYKSASLYLHHELARDVAKESIVLLKNNGVLPLKEGIKLGVIGSYAETPRLNGGGSATLKPYQLDTPLEFLRKHFDVSYAKGYDNDTFLDEGMKESLNICMKSDVVLLFVGTTPSLESEGRDRPHMSLPYAHIELIKFAIKNAKRCVVINQSGSAVDLRDAENADAIVQSWFLGGAGGSALVELIRGEANFSGRLSETFPLRIEDTPLFQTFPQFDKVEYTNDIIELGYRYYDGKNKPVLYPFGYGLSYASFEHSKCTLSLDENNLYFDVHIKNTSDVDGHDVIQLYIQNHDTALMHPTKRLVGFLKVFVKAHDSANHRLTVPFETFSVFDPLDRIYKTLDTDYTVMVGVNARDIFYTHKIHIKTNEYAKLEASLEQSYNRFLKYLPERLEILDAHYKLEWYEKEEPIIRVIKRIQKRQIISEEEAEQIKSNLLKE